MQDAIQRTIIINATKETIYGAIAPRSGFASLPPDVAARSYDENAEGWDPMMRRLETCLRTSEAGVS